MENGKLWIFHCLDTNGMLMSADSILCKFPIRCIEYIIKLALILNSLNFDP